MKTTLKWIWRIAISLGAIATAISCVVWLGASLGHWPAPITPYWTIGVAFATNTLVLLQWAWK